MAFDQSYYDLINAAYSSRIKVAEKLIASGAKTDAIDGQGSSLLMMSIGFNSNEKQVLEFIKMLVKHGADVHYINPKNENALFHACRSCNFQAANFLIEQGIDQNLVNTDGKKAIDVIPGKSLLDLLSGNLNVRHEVSILQENEFKEDIIKACSSGHYKKLEKLLKQMDGVSFKLEDLLPLHNCCSHNGNSIACADVLLARNIDINQQDKQKITPLMKSILISNFKLADHLLSKGADITLTNRDGLTAIDIATNKRNQYSNANSAGHYSVDTLISKLNAMNEKMKLNACLNDESEQISQMMLL